MTPLFSEKSPSHRVLFPTRVDTFSNQILSLRGLELAFRHSRSHHMRGGKFANFRNSLLMPCSRSKTKKAGQET